MVYRDALEWTDHHTQVFELTLEILLHEQDKRGLRCKKLTHRYQRALDYLRERRRRHWRGANA